MIIISAEIEGFPINCTVKKNVPLYAVKLTWSSGANTTL